MDTRLKDIISKENRNALYAFLGAQTFNIIVTMLIAWLMFGVVKPAIWPTTPEATATVQTIEATDVTKATETTESTETTEATDDTPFVVEEPVVAPEIAFE